MFSYIDRGSGNMKKVLAVIGSPRKGETLKAVKRFEEELNKHEEVLVEYIMLGSYGLSDCTGCHNCISKGSEYCRESLKVRELQDKMQQADGVILATPVYNQHVTALMKKFMDYYTFLWHRPAMFGVRFMGISSGGGMFKPVFKYLKMNVENWGGVWTGSLGVPHYEALTEKYRKKADDDIKSKASDFLKAISAKYLPRPSLGKLLWFGMWKMNAIAAKNEIKKDYEHWTETGWFDMDYYYDTEVGFVKSIISATAVSIARRIMRRVYVGY